MTWTRAIQNFREGSKTIAGTELPVMTGDLEVTKLKFWPENPRLYSILDVETKLPDQGTIEEALLKKDFVKQLRKDIEANGGLMEPIIVRDKTWEVFEGNCRLAAYRALNKKDPIKWGLIKSEVLPYDTDEEKIFTILGQLHIRGKKDWDKFEQAGYLYRRMQQGFSEEHLAGQIGLKVGDVKKDIEIYLLMREHKETNSHRWSYWEVYLSNREIRKLRKDEETAKSIDKVIGKQIKKQMVGTAMDMRKMLVEIARHPKTLERVVEGITELIPAFTGIKKKGLTETFLVRLRKMDDWTRDPDTRTQMRRHIRGSKEKKRKTTYHLKRIERSVKNLKEIAGE